MALQFQSYHFRELIKKLAPQNFSKYGFYYLWHNSFLPNEVLRIYASQIAKICLDESFILNAQSTHTLELEEGFYWNENDDSSEFLELLNSIQKNQRFLD